MVMSQVGASINTLLKHYEADNINKCGKNIKIYNYSMPVLMWDWFTTAELKKKGITYTKYDNDSAYLTSSFDNGKCKLFANAGFEIGKGRNTVVLYNVKNVQILYKKYTSELIVYCTVSKEEMYCPNVRRKMK